MTEFDLGIDAKPHRQAGKASRQVKRSRDPKLTQGNDFIIEQGFRFRPDRVLPVAIMEQAINQASARSIQPDQLENDLHYPDFMISFIEFDGARYTLFKNTARDSIYVIPPFSPTPIPFADPAEAAKWAEQDARLTGSKVDQA